MKRFLKWWRGHWQAGEKAGEKAMERALPRRFAETHAIALSASRAFVINAGIEAGKIAIGGWRTDAWRFHIGDYLVIDIGNGRTTRYQIDRATFRHADSWYTLDCTFAPRGDKPAEAEARGMMSGRI